jgi:hypothetical protein
VGITTLGASGALVAAGDFEPSGIMPGVVTSAELVKSMCLPVNGRADEAVQVLRWPGRRLVLVRGEAELTVYDLAELANGVDRPAVVFPAPWPRRMNGVVSVSPDLEFAVFPRVHAVQAVEPSGAVRWELPHSCWEPSCLAIHVSDGEYAGRRDHRYPDQGSSWVSVDGKTVWVHVRGPLPGDEPPAGADPWLSDERWLVLDAAEGVILAQAGTETAAAGSHHIAHPDPRVMGLSVGEGQDGSPLLWGRFDGRRIELTRVGVDDHILVAAAPTGDRFVAITHSARDEMTVHRLPDGDITGTVFARWLAADGNPAADTRVSWDLAEMGFVDQHTLIASTSRSGDDEPRHWLINVETLKATAVQYPKPVASRPLGLEDGTWLVIAHDGCARLEIWRAR